MSQDFERDFPNVKFEIVQGITSKLIDMLDNDLLDIVLLSINHENKNQLLIIKSMIKENNELPLAAKEGFVFLGWTNGVEVYKTICEETLQGATLTPAFVPADAKSIEIDYVGVRQTPRAGNITLTDATFSGEPYPSATFREKILLKYNDKGQLVVIATELNGVRITKDPSKSYYVEGKSNVDYDFCLLGYGTTEDAEILALEAQVGDIFVINGPKSQYTGTTYDVKAPSGLTGYIIKAEQ